MNKTSPLHQQSSGAPPRSTSCPQPRTPLSRGGRQMPSPPTLPSPPFSSVLHQRVPGTRTCTFSLSSLSALSADSTPAMLSTALQVLAFGLALLGALGGAVATLLPNWAVSAGSRSGSVTAFWASDLPASSKYQPGGALCVTFVSASFLLAGGIIFCMSCPGNVPRSGLPDGGGGRGCCPEHQDTVLASWTQRPGWEPLKHQQNTSAWPQTDQDCGCHRHWTWDLYQDQILGRGCDCDRNQKQNQDKDRDRVQNQDQNQDGAEGCYCDRDQDQWFRSSPSKLCPKNIKGSYGRQEYV